MTALPINSEKLREKFRVPDWYWSVIRQDWRAASSGIALVFSLLCFVLIAKEASIGARLTGILLTFLFSCLVPFKSSVHRSFFFRVLPLSQEELKRFLWWYHMAPIKIGLVFWPVALIILFAPYSIVSLLLAFFDPDAWPVLLKFGVAVALVLSVYSGGLVLTSSLSCHWLFKYLPFRNTRLKLALLAGLPAIAAFFAWPHVLNSESVFPKIVFILWSFFAIKVAGDLFQAPYVMPKSLESANENNLVSIRKQAQVPAAFPSRSSFWKWLAIQWLIRSGWILALAPGTGFILYTIFWSAKGLSFELRENAILLGVFLLFLPFPIFGKSFPLREYRMLPITGRHYTLAWMGYFFAAALWLLLMAAITLGFLLHLHWHDIDSAILLTPLFLLPSCVITLLGHARMRVKLPIALLIAAIAIVLMLCCPAARLTFWMMTLLLPLLIFTVGFCLEVWTVTHNRAAYYRRSDLEDFGNVEHIPMLDLFRPKDRHAER